MTKSQIKAIDTIKDKIENQLFYSKDNYEIKKFKITENKYFVSLDFETGMKGDEGSLGEYFGRDKGYILIGKKGGITYYNSQSKKKKFNGNILSIVVDQRL